MKENYFLDDGAYLVNKLLGELVIAKQSGKVLTDLIATLKEPAKSEEYRLKILVEDGWFLLRLSLHDPVLPLNIESNVAGGVERMRRRLGKFFPR